MAGEEELLAGAGVCIRPPRLEDAGLEDCALPPESIAEAFALAASAVSSRLARFSISDDDEDEEDRLPAPGGGGCVDGTVPARGAVPDALVDGRGVSGGGGADEVVVVGGGSGGRIGGDQVVIGGRGKEEDRVVVVGDGRGEKQLGNEEGCVEGIAEGVGEPGPAQGDGEDEEVPVEVEAAILVPDFA